MSLKAVSLVGDGTGPTPTEIQDIARTYSVPAYPNIMATGIDEATAAPVSGDYVVISSSQDFIDGNGIKITSLFTPWRPLHFVNATPYTVYLYLPVGATINGQTQYTLPANSPVTIMPIIDNDAVVLGGLNSPRYTAIAGLSDVFVLYNGETWGYTFGSSIADFINPGLVVSSQQNTTSNTPTNLKTFTPSINSSGFIEGKIIASRTGGANATGAIGDTLWANFSANYRKDGAGVLTLYSPVITTDTTAINANLAAWTVAFLNTGSQVAIRVTGVATTDIQWQFVTGNFNGVNWA